MSKPVFDIENELKTIKNTYGLGKTTWTDDNSSKGCLIIGLHNDWLKLISVEGDEAKRNTQIKLFLEWRGLFDFWKS